GAVDPIRMKLVRPRIVAIRVAARIISDSPIRLSGQIHPAGLYRKRIDARQTGTYSPICEIRFNPQNPCKVFGGPNASYPFAATQLRTYWKLSCCQGW